MLISIFQYTIDTLMTLLGQTKRPLHIRTEEHKNNIKLNPKLDFYNNTLF